MRRGSWLAAIGVLSIAMAACGLEGEEGPAAAGVDSKTLTAPVMWHAQSGKTGEVPGASGTLETTSSGASVRLETSRLKGGHAHTVWWVVVNKPSACAEYPNHCAPADVLGNPKTEAQVAYGTGRVVAESGRATFTMQLPVGDLPDGWYKGRGFTNPTGAEIHVILNDHGPALDEFMPDMIRTYRGGCTDESLPEGFPQTALRDGKPGPNTCRLMQSVVFQQ